MNTQYFRSIRLDGIDIFYREAGNPEKPVILLLHGFPSSSHMFRNLINDLSDEFRLIAPDYPGGRKRRPDRAVDPRDGRRPVGLPAHAVSRAPLLLWTL